MHSQLLYELLVVKRTSKVFIHITDVGFQVAHIHTFRILTYL
jgi:hypothetical protein